MCEGQSTILSSSSNPNTVVSSHSYLIHPTFSKISGNKPNSYPFQLNGTTRTSPSYITVCPNHLLLLNTLTITNPKSPPAPPCVPSLFSLYILPQDHQITSHLHQSSKPVSWHATANNFYLTSNIMYPT